MTFIKAYADLLILQYRGEPKASAEVIALVAHFSRSFDAATEFLGAFDVDTATGNQLDIIGSVVGMPRQIPAVIPKQFFGFSDNVNATSFGDAFAPTKLFSFFDGFGVAYADTELGDPDYGDFIKVKIAKNTAQAYISSGDRIGIQQAVIDAIDGAYAVDGRDMMMTVYVDYATDLIKLNIINTMNLLPAPQGVGIDFVNYSAAATFGFSDNPNAVSFDNGTFSSGIIYE